MGPKGVTRCMGYTMYSIGTRSNRLVATGGL